MKKKSLLKTCLGLSLALTFCPIAWAADDPTVQRLIDQARYWQQKKRDDLAADAWRKLLRVNPDHPLALVQLGTLEARAGHNKEAEELYQRLKTIQPAPPGLAELETALKVQSAAPEELKAARKQAQTGKPDEAVKTYRTILGETQPTGQFGLEYYQTLGGTREGWDEARRGMEQLAKSHPGDNTYLMALARHLSYRESTRREGIRQLAHLGQQDPEAQKAWRQALVWLGAKSTDRALFQQYLSLFPNDQAVRERLRLLDRPAIASVAPDLAELERRAGFRWLDTGEVDKAEARFREILSKKPGDLDAQGGLATVLMRKGIWIEASALLDQIVANGGKRWKAAQQSAHYWTLIHEIGAARQGDKNTSQADIEAKLQQALRIDPKHSAGLLILADILNEKRDFARAEPLYRQVLRQEPAQAGAFLGLVSILTQTGREQEALALIAAQAASPELKMVGLNQTKAQALFKLAQTDEQSGAYDSAMQRLEDALLLDPASPWVRLALARLYQRLNDVAAANSIIDNLVDAFPDLPEAWHARALLFAEQERPSEALLALERINPAKRTAAMAQDQRRLWIQVQTIRARQFQQQGQSQQSVNLLNQAQTAAGDEVSLLSTVAGAWSETGQAARALQILRSVHARQGNSDVGARIQYASLLLSTGQDAELATVLRDLAKQTQLTARQFEDLNKIILAYTLRQTDTLREAGRLADAYDTVSPALAQSNDTRLTMALARIYQSGGEPGPALQLAESVIEREPNDLEHRLFAAGVAMAAKQLDQAAEHVGAALELAPDHPRVLAQAGRVEKLRGNIPKALEYFQYAQALEHEKAAFGNVPGNLALRLVDANATLPAAAAGAVGATTAVRNLILPIPNAVRARNNGEAAPTTSPGFPAAPNAINNSILPLPGARQFVDPLNQVNQLPQVPQVPQARTSYAPAPAPAPANNNAQFEAGYQAALAKIQAQQTQPTTKARSAQSAYAVQATQATQAAAAQIQDDAPPSGQRNKNSKRSKRSKYTKHSRSKGHNAQVPDGNALQQALAALGSTGTRQAATLAPLPPVAVPAAIANTTAAPATITAAPEWRSTTREPAPAAAQVLRLDQRLPEAPPSAAPQNEAPSLFSRLSQAISGKTRHTAQSVPKTPTANASAAAALATTLNPANRERTMAEEIQDIELKFATTLDLGAAYRNRSGEVGMNRLSEIEIPLEFKTSLNYDHHLTLRMTPVLLSAGEIILADPANITRFGSGALGPFLATPYPSEFIQASGVALAIAYGDENLRIDLGTSPLGFKVGNVVGGISYKHTVDDLTLKASLNRRSVTDSVLSYAGARDPLTGQTWGGVVKTGIRLDANYGSEQLGFYGGGGIASLTGRAVKANTEWEASAGAYWRLYQSLNQQITVGLNLNALGYHDNLSHFNLGHGGYFSPQRYVSLGLPLDAAGRFGKLSYQIGLDVGLRHITQDSAAYFPNDPALQAQWQARIAALPTTTPIPDYFRASYKGDNSSGTGANLRISFEYLLASQFALGGRFSFDNSRNYTQQTGLLYLRYAFSPLPTPVLFPPRGLQALYLGDPL